MVYHYWPKTQKNMKRHVESTLQCACVKWFRLQHPRLALLLNSVPNGGARNVVTGAIMKAEGAVRGVADLELNVARGGWFGMKIEMKTATGRQSDTQKAWQRAVEAEGYLYVLCRGFDDFRHAVGGYLAMPPTRRESG